MSLSTWILSHRRSILFLLIALAVAGFFIAFKLPVALFPNIQFPRVVVNLDAGDMTAKQMALEVTTPVEQAVRQVAGVESVRSTTSRGSADISVSFAWGTNMPIATLQIESAISQILPTLPNGVQMQTTQMSPTQFPMLAYSLTSNRLSLTQLRDLGLYQLRPILLGVNGVSGVDVIGGGTDEYEITVNPDRLRAYSLTLTEVTQAATAANVLSVVGKMEDHYQLYLLVSQAKVKNVHTLQQMIIKTTNNGVIRLKDVATVTLSAMPEWTRTTADGQDAVLLNVYQQPGANSVQLAKDVKIALKTYQSQMPAGVKVANWYDQSLLVTDSAKSVRDAILIGILLASAVLYIFLRNVKVMLIAMLVVPAVLASATVLLYALNMSFNIMTLGGMAAAIGLIIDDAIVMLEHIMERWHKEQHHRYVMQAAQEYLKPLAGSSAATLVIFIPLAFLTGVTGAFFKALSLTMAASLLISFFITWLAVPLLADHWLTDKDAQQPKPSPFMMRLQQHYTELMKQLLRKPQKILLFLAPLALIGWLAYHEVGSGFMPHMDEGGFILDYRAAPGTSLTETDRLLKQVEAILKANPNVDTYSRRTGTQLGGGVTEANEGDFFVRLKPLPRPDSDTIMDDVRTQVTLQVPGLDIELAQLMEDLIGDLTAVPEPIEIKLFSDDPQQLQQMADSVSQRLEKISGVVDINDGINPAGDAIEITIDPNKAAFENISADQITQLLQENMMGLVVTNTFMDNKIVGLRVLGPRAQFSTEQQLQNMLLQASDGHFFRLKDVAVIQDISGEPQINHENLKRMVAVTARINGRDMGSVMKDITKQMNLHPLPKGTYYQLGGLYQQQQIAFKGLLTVIFSAFVLVFLLLLFLYERFQIAISIMAIPLLAMLAVFIGLWITGTELNISAMMGMTMIVGIVTEVAIFYFSEYQRLVMHRHHYIALIEAGWNRMRPIVMTTLAAILALLPLAFAIGTGSAMQQALAIAIISGLVVQVPLCLFVMPILFFLLHKWR